jgi:hypothetical protein
MNRIDFLRYPASEMIKRRGPFTDPREGRLLRQIRWAFEAHAVDVLTTHDLLEWCYCAPAIRRLMTSRTGKPQSWPREMVKRAALKVCTPIGRSPRGSGRPMMWRRDPERMRLRGQKRGGRGRSKGKGSRVAALRDELLTGKWSFTG